jgi:NADH-quinone oxidoreductase subunit L
LAGLPLVTAGWFSKEALLAAVWASGPWGGAVFAAAILTAMLTATYAFRLVLIAASPGPASHAPPWGGVAIRGPLLLLAALALGGGFGVGALVRAMGTAPGEVPLLAVLVGAAAPLLGAAGARFFTRHPERLARLGAGLRPFGARRFDALTYLLLVRPYRHLAQMLARQDAGHHLVLFWRVGYFAQRLPPPAMAFLPDRIDRAWTRLAEALRDLSTDARRSQTGLLRDYSWGLALGIAALLLLAWGSVWR